MLLTPVAQRTNTNKISVVRSSSVLLIFVKFPRWNHCSMIIHVNFLLLNIALKMSNDNFHILLQNTVSLILYAVNKHIPNSNRIMYFSTWND